MKEQMNRLKEMLSKKGKKKIVENSIIAIIIGVIIIIAGGAFFDGGEKQKEKENVDPIGDTKVQEVGKVIPLQENVEIEKKIEDILAKIEGAGRVDVLITYVSGKEIVPASDLKKNENDTDEKDTSGGTRKIKESDYESKIAFEEVQGEGKKPIILKEMEPLVKGVVVVADGAGDATVRECLTKAVQALLDIEVHKVQVFSRNK